MENADVVKAGSQANFVGQLRAVVLRVLTERTQRAEGPAVGVAKRGAPPFELLDQVAWEILGNFLLGVVTGLLSARLDSLFSSMKSARLPAQRDATLAALEAAAIELRKTSELLLIDKQLTEVREAIVVTLRARLPLEDVEAAAKIITEELAQLMRQNTHHSAHRDEESGTSERQRIGG